MLEKRRKGKEKREKKVGIFETITSKQENTNVNFHVSNNDF